MLTKVVLPAPLLPIRLTRSPALTRTLSSAAATTAPKRLPTFTACSNGVLIGPPWPCGSCPRAPKEPRRGSRGASAFGAAARHSSLDPQRADAARQEADHEQQEQ